MQKKKNTQLRLSDFAAILICSSAMIISLFLFFKNINKELVKNTENQIATISFKYRSAQRKFSDGVIWDKLRNNSTVYNGDTIRTASSSEATVYFDNGNVLDLHENTLTQIYTKKKDGEISIIFDRGNLSLQTGDNADRVIIESKKGNIVIESKSSLSVSINNSIQKVQVIEGNAQVITNTAAVVLSAGEVIETAEDSVILDEPSVAMIEPIQNYRYLNHTGLLTNIIFRWKTSNMPADAKLFLNLYTDKRYSVLYASYDVTDWDEFDTPLPNGMFYWQLVPVVSNGSVKTRYDSGQLLILDAPSPSVIAPKDAEFTYEDETPQIRFTWKGNEWVSLYQVEVANNSTMMNPVTVKTSQSESCYISSLTDGDWYWRVIPVYTIQKTDETFSSQINSFSINKTVSASNAQPQQPEIVIKTNLDDSNKSQTVSTPVGAGKRMTELSGPELFLNNDFSAGDKYWDYWESQGIGTVMDFSSGAFVLSGGLRGMDEWNICLAKTSLILSKYSVYELRFDAFSTNPSDTLQVTLESRMNDSTNAEENYHHRSCAEQALSAQPKTYTIDLIAGEFDDLEGSLIFLLGDCTGIISIDNVSFKRKGSWKPESFEIISNGTFEYRAALWDYWQSENSSAKMDFSSGAFVVSGGLREIDEWNIWLAKDKSIKLLKNSVYELTFDASSTNDTDMISCSLRSYDDGFNDKGENESFWSTARSPITTKLKTYKVKLASGEFDDNAGSLFFVLGLCKGTITIDNVTLERTGTWKPEKSEMVYNGDFDLGSNFWNTYTEVYKTGGIGDFSNGKFTLNEIQRGTGNWYIQLSTNGYFTYKRGETYSVSFDAASTESDHIWLNAGEDGFDVNSDGNIWTAWASNEFLLTSQMKTYTLNFTMDNKFEDPKGRLNFCLGNTKGIITIDNVSVRPVQ